MTDKTDLIELTDSEERMVSIIGQAFPEYFDGAVEGQNYGDSEKLTRLARALSEHFIEQACEAIDNVHNPCQAVSTPAFMRIRADIKKSIEEL